MDDDIFSKIFGGGLFGELSLFSFVNSCVNNLSFVNSCVNKLRSPTPSSPSWIHQLSELRCFLSSSSKWSLSSFSNVHYCTACMMFKGGMGGGFPFGGAGGGGSRRRKKGEDVGHPLS